MSHWCRIFALGKVEESTLEHYKLGYRTSLVPRVSPNFYCWKSFLSRVISYVNWYTYDSTLNFNIGFRNCFMLLAPLGHQVSTNENANQEVHVFFIGNPTQLASK